MSLLTSAVRILLLVRVQLRPLETPELLKRLAAIRALLVTRHTPALTPTEHPAKRQRAAAATSAGLSGLAVSTDATEHDPDAEKEEAVTCLVGVQWKMSIEDEHRPSWNYATAPTS